MSEIAGLLRARGMRLTAARRRILAALERLDHATPDQVYMALIHDEGERVSPSTVYRSLDALTTLGVVAATHLDKGVPVYHLADRANHLHLVCRTCGSQSEAEVTLADGLAGALRRVHRFDADMAHLVVRGECSQCQEDQ